jgi:hypothetical protein
LINNNFIVIYLPLSILITTFLLLFIFFVLNHYGFVFEFNSKASIFPSFNSPIFYLSVILISGLCFVIDYSIKLFDLFFSNSLSSKIILNGSLKKRNSSLAIIKTISNPYSLYKNLKRKSNANPEISNKLKSSYPKMKLKQSNKSLCNHYQNKISYSNGIFKSEFSEIKLYNNSINN